MPTLVAQFLAQPYSNNMSAFRWVLFIGFLVLALIGWRMVYSELSSVEPQV